MKNIDLITRGWKDYELLDSGGGRKLERFGPHLLIRPETQALWGPQDLGQWKSAAAEFRFEGGKGNWHAKGKLPEPWESEWGKARFTLRPTSFKHIGIFPEQAANWEWLAKRTAAIQNPRVLNLFGYTGIASIICAAAGAEVTHVDASKQSNAWSKENAELSGVGEGSIRYILDDALKFTEREVRRDSLYEGIILDPPAFGRGAKGEVWHIEEGLPKLLGALSKILSTAPGSFLLLNGYAAGYSPTSFMQALMSAFPDVAGEFGELQIEEAATGRALPSGIYARFAR